jgi:hypothetical protein
MARKPLLTEAEIRSFMKLANLAPIGEVKLQEMGFGHEETVAEEEEEELEMDAELGAVEEPPVPDAPDDDMGAELDADLDMDMDADLDADVGGGDTEEQFMDLVQQLADLVGVDVSMDDGAEMDAGDELEMGDDVDSLEGGDDLGDEAALDDELPPEPDEEELDDDPPGMKMYENDEDIVNEVARRVAARLQAEAGKKKLAEELTEKIFNRLTNNG